MRSAILASFLALGLAGLAGCTNPNSIGVQVFGTVTVHCVKSSDGSPVPGALVSVGTVDGSTGADGSVALAQIPVGVETFIARATGLKGTQTTTIVQDANPDITIQMQPAN
jgi:hypothetical protein